MKVKLIPPVAFCHDWAAASPSTKPDSFSLSLASFSGFQELSPGTLV